MDFVNFDVWFTGISINMVKSQSRRLQSTRGLLELSKVKEGRESVLAAQTCDPSGKKGVSILQAPSKFNCYALYASWSGTSEPPCMNPFEPRSESSSSLKHSEYHSDSWASHRPKLCKSRGFTLSYHLGFSPADKIWVYGQKIVCLPH